MTEKKKQSFDNAPPIRFMMELLIWGALIFLGYWYIVVVFIALLSIFNTPGDKKPIGDEGFGILVPGFVRLLIEFSQAAVGLYFIFELGEVWLAITGVLTLLWIVFDRSRFSWLLGFREDPPAHVTYIYANKKKSA